MLKLIPTSSYNARLSLLQVNTKKSFQNLDRRPSDVFHYYLQLRIGKLGGYTRLKEQNMYIPFVKRIRREWDLLCDSKKRVYNALFFKFNRIDFTRLTDEELARYLTIPIPTSSEYLLFRSKYKVQFNKMWDMRASATLRSSDSNRKFNVSFKNWKDTQKTDFEKVLNFHFRYQEMCKSCQKVWKEQVTPEQKELLIARVEFMRNEFKRRLRAEREELFLFAKFLEQSLLEQAQPFESFSEILSGTAYRSKVVTDSLDSFHFPPSKKK